MREIREMRDTRGERGEICKFELTPKISTISIYKFTIHIVSTFRVNHDVICFQFIFNKYQFKIIIC